MFLYVLTIALAVNAQVGIGTKTVFQSSILNFNDNDYRGIILPATTTVTTPVKGTLTFDRTTKTVQYFDGIWKSLTKTGELPTTLNANNDIKSGMIIGKTTSSAPGVLVLESTTKALVLPRMNEPHLNIPNPEAGTICYDLTNKVLCIYNGKEWSFWQ